MRVLRIKNAKCTGYCFYILNTNPQEHFEIFISVSLRYLIIGDVYFDK